MSTAELRANIYQLLQSVNDDSLLQAIYALLSKAENNDDWYDNLSIEAKASIQRGIEDADNRNFVSQEEITAKVNKLLKRA